MPIQALELALGRLCPSFLLPSVDGQTYDLPSFGKSKALLVAFICNHCPYVMAIEDRLLGIARAYSESDLQVVGICSNAWRDYPEDAPGKLLERSLQKAYGFPYLVDETQEVARRFEAVCTPDLFLYDAERRLYYHGRIDDNWKDEKQVTRHELREAVDSLLAGKARPSLQHPTVGCSIKWLS